MKTIGTKGCVKNMRLMIDTNIILDLIFKRNDYINISELFRNLNTKNIEIFVSASSVTDLFYIMKRITHDIQKTYQLLGYVLKLVTVLPATSEDITCAFQQNWKDFEDCVLYTIAQKNRISAIISNNKKDFEDDTLPIYTASEYLNQNRR